MRRKVMSVAALSIALAMSAVVVGLVTQHASAKGPAEPQTPRTQGVTVAGNIPADQLWPVFDEFTSRAGNVLCHSGGWGWDDFGNCVANGNCPTSESCNDPALCRALPRLAWWQS